MSTKNPGIWLWYDTIWLRTIGMLFPFIEAPIMIYGHWCTRLSCIHVGDLDPIREKSSSTWKTTWNRNFDIVMPCFHVFRPLMGLRSIVVPCFRAYDTAVSPAIYSPWSETRIVREQKRHWAIQLLPSNKVVNTSITILKVKHASESHPIACDFLDRGPRLFLEFLLLLLRQRL